MHAHRSSTTATPRRRRSAWARNCPRVAARATATISGPVTSNPLPAFIYVPSEIADPIHLKLMVRVDDGFRVTLRVYGLDVPDGALSAMRIVDMDSNQMLYEQIYGFQRFPNAAGGSPGATCGWRWSRAATTCRSTASSR